MDFHIRKLTTFLRWTFLIAMVSLTTPAKPALAQSAHPDSINTNTASAWGQIPAEHDTVTAAMTRDNVAAWEYPLMVPYRMITIPVGFATKVVVMTGYTISKQPLFNKLSESTQGAPILGGLYLFNFTAGGSDGFGVGLTARYPNVLGENNEFKARIQSTINSVRKITVGWRTDPTASQGWEFGGGYRKRPNTKYFGLGESSEASRESIFRQSMSWLGLERRWDIVGDTSFHLTTLYSVLENGPSETQTDRYPDLSEEFAGDLPFGYGAASNGWSFSAALLHDSTIGDGRPEQGGFHRAEVEYFTASDMTEAAHWTYRVDLQQFIPLWHERRTLALRGVLVVQDNENENPIHFQRLITNDDPDLLRGFRDFRFRDEGIAIVTAEYRWPIWTMREVESSGLDAYIFTDVGQVFDEYSDINSSSVTNSYGTGLRLINANNNFTASLEIAWSEEGTQFRLLGDQVFQYLKGGLFHGRDQVPSR